jgi:hypothetical protein
MRPPSRAPAERPLSVGTTSRRIMRMEVAKLVDTAAHRLKAPGVGTAPVLEGGHPSGFGANQLLSPITPAIKTPRRRVARSAGTTPNRTVKNDIRTKAALLRNRVRLAGPDAARRRCVGLLSLRGRPPRPTDAVGR